jgi:cell division protein FtsW (lipid II flippase)
MAQEKTAYAEWTWVGRYLAVIALSLILAAILGNMSLFEKTYLTKRLNAAHIVEFLGFGASLVLAWLLAQRATLVVRKQGGKAQAAVHLILPVASLIVMALAYSVVLLVVKPFLGAIMIKVINWFFILVIVACAAWLVMAVFDKSAALTDLLTGESGRK